MTFNAGNALGLLARFDFQRLFTEELGWDRHTAALAIDIGPQTFPLRAVAQKRGMVAWLHAAPKGQRIPDRAMRKKIEKQVARSTLEHLIIFTDTEREEQIWCWARRETGKPVSVLEHFWHGGSGNTAFLQKLARICFSIDEEERLTQLAVMGRARDAFDVEKVTKRFFTQFKAEHEAFLAFIEGIDDLADKEWYASLMLNRLMFVYFMQRKGFLDGKRDYLRDKLDQCQRNRGKDQFYSFYRYFLLRLFHEGLGGRARNAALEKLIGRIPYLNGGLFEKHPIETRCKDIEIPDEAFVRVFNYFDSYDWHLDERPLKKDNEINPDVLGYIFEKYINQKQMGAYYTKEDITGYISKNTIIPFLFDAAKAKCKVAFDNPGGPTIWDHLREDPDRYIYGAVRHGAEHPLPPEIEAGVGDVAARTQWNRPAPDNYALPTEIWREVVARRQRYEGLRAKLAAGEVREINDLITLNLDMTQFAQDVIERSEGPELLRAFWKAIESVTVLDPTCGSGAFLFAALNILEPLYETSLDRMEAFVADLDRTGASAAAKRLKDFRETLAKVRAHPNARYFILKSIILNNLFGVDIMEEAVEICKLRLFLKLAAQVEPNQKLENLGIEPLPDIDFNIRAGNTLVGYATYEEVKRALGSRLDFDDALKTISIRAADAQQAFDAFRAAQTSGDGSILVEQKADVRNRLKDLAEELNRNLAVAYGVNRRSAAAYANWLKSHQPFHWFIEFHGILQDGGFDVILGNPPYIETSKIDDYDIPADTFSTSTCGNIYALICERSYSLHKMTGRFGMIIPVSCVSTERMQPLRNLWSSYNVSTHASFYSGDAHPSVLFNGVKFRLMILLQEKSSREPKYFSTGFQRWFSQAREHLFPCIEYVEVSRHMTRLGLLPKLGSSQYSEIISKFIAHKKSLGSRFAEKTKYIVFSHRIVAHFIKAMTFAPFFCNERDGQKRSDDYKKFGVNSELSMHSLSALLNSTCFYIWFVAYSDVYHCGREIIIDFPIDLNDLVASHGNILQQKNTELMLSLRNNSVRRSIRYKKTGLVEYDEFYPKKSKSIIDEIDLTLANYFGFSVEEADFILNYDIKFRLNTENFGE